MQRYLIPFGLFLGTVVLGMMYLQDPTHDLFSDTDAGAGISFEQLEQMKQETVIKMSLEQQRARLEKNRDRSILNPGARDQSQYHESRDEIVRDVKADLIQPPSRRGSVTLDQEMDAFLARREQFELLEEAQKQAYAESFIREARKMGFEVKISPDLQIESVNKIEGP